MTIFKASSSGFVFATAVLLLLVVINIHRAPAAAAACSSSKVMLFNSSSLEVVEEVAKDQGITEIAIDDHHEIQRRVLQGGVGGKAGSLTQMLTDLINDARKPFKATRDEKTELKNIFNRYCLQSCSKSSGATTGNCGCQNTDSKNVLHYISASRSCYVVYKVYYCCNVGGCTFCCGSQQIPQYNTNPISNQGSPSSGSRITYYVVTTVIAIFTTISSYMFFF